MRTPAGVVELDPGGRLPGRGAYLCRDAACIDLAGRRRALEHALKAPVPAGLLDDLAATVAAATTRTESIEAHPTGAVDAPAPGSEGGPDGSK